MLKMNIQLSTGNLNQEGNGGEAGAARWGSLLGEEWARHGLGGRDAF